MTESETLKAINARLANACWHRRELGGAVNKICQLLDVAPGTFDAKDVEKCVHGLITLDEALLRIRNRKLAELATKLAADNGE